MDLEIFENVTDLLDCRLKARAGGIHHSLSWDHERGEKYLSVRCTPAQAEELGLSKEDVAACMALAAERRGRAMGVIQVPRQPLPCH